MSDESKPALIDLVSLYIVADKYFINSLQMEITEMFEKHFNLQGINTAFAHHIFFRLLRATGLSDPDLCPLTNMLVEKLATDLRRHGWGQYINEVDPGLAEGLVEDPNMMVKLVQRLADSTAYLDHSVRGRKKLKRERSNLSFEEDRSLQRVVTID